MQKIGHFRRRVVPRRASPRSRFILAESDGLVLETIQTYSANPPRRGQPPIETKGIASKQELRLLKLKGTWRANPYNELVFEASGRKGKPEKFTFKGAWKLNKNQHIEYKTENNRDTLTFKGHWKILSDKKLVYILEGSSKSKFEFKAQFESASMHPKKGAIRYRIGIGARRRSRISPHKLLILYGEWKFSRNLGLLFNIDYGYNRIQAISLGAVVTFSPNKIELALRNEFGKPIGITLTLTRKLFKSLNAKAYLRLTHRRQEKAIESGITIPF
jgi:hypothetical protein